MKDKIPNLGKSLIQELVEKYQSLINYNSPIIEVLEKEDSLSNLLAKINEILKDNPEGKIWLKNTSTVTDPKEHEGAQELEDFDDFPMEDSGRRVPYMEVSVLTKEGNKVHVDDLTKETRDFTRTTFIEPTLYETLLQYCQD